MLINAQRAEEIRVAIVAGSTLDAFQVEVAEAGLRRGNIYRAIVVNLQPSLSAAFVDYGAEKHAFLKGDDVVQAAYHRQPGKGRFPRVETVLERGRPVLVQVSKDAMGEKGAAVTTKVSIAGRYLVLMPFEDSRGVSRKVEDDAVRKELLERAATLDVPEGLGFIIRTNAVGQTKATLNRDVGALLRIWKRIREEASRGKGPRLLYSDQDLIVQALRDYLDPTIEEVLVDSDDVFEKVKAYMRSFMPRAKTQVVRYTERMPLFSRFQLEPQIEAIFQRTVSLPSGGSLVIDRTEALTAIDVNSGKATRAANQEETAVNINLEAAPEVARQLRLRDIGGLVVVDFIDMRSGKHQRTVEKAMREALKNDKARTWVGKISPNGLLEINRQRIKQALQLRTHRPCPTCRGMGSIASPEHVALSMLRRIEAAAAGGSVHAVRISLHPELADAIQNGYRQEIASLEREFDIRIEVIAATSMHRAEEKVEWVNRESGELAAGQRPELAAVTAADLAVEEERPAEARRGKRARKEKVEKEEQTAPTPPATEEGAEKRSRRRRRGGRRRKKPAAVEGAAPAPDGVAEEAAEQMPAPPALESGATPAESPVGTGGEGEEAAGRAKKRRRRRRRHPKPEAGEVSASAGVSAPADPPEGST